jgi:transcription initiation factor TFIIIB Brf1 subunit/transcription initiation factor TFIIB
MYPAVGFTHERQRDLLMRAQQDRQASQLRKLQRASRRADRAQQSLSRALNDVLRVRSQLNSGL